MKYLTTAAALSLVLWLGSTAVAETTLEKQLAVAGSNAGPLRAFLAEASSKHGALGGRAATFLVQGMPPRDLKALSKDFLLENLTLALKAREQFPWAQALPEAVFFNDVLPYASLDETRESWRGEFHAQCTELVKDCKTTTEAAQAINQGFFKLINVHYNTGRKAPNQSPAESKALGMATCTGLSIILVDACRSVGVPARVAGTALWANKRGNHTWVEIYDGGTWFFTGADEYNKRGLNKAWFTGDASKAIADDWKHAIWATSWKHTGSHFPMVWNLEDKSVPGVNVTARYAKPATKAAAQTTVYLRAWDTRGGSRLALAVDLLDATGKKLQTVRTRAGTTDLNDMAALKVQPGVTYRLRIVRDGVERSEKLQVQGRADVTRELVWSELGTGSATSKLVRDWLALLPEERHLSVPMGALTKAQAAEVTSLIQTVLAEESAAARTKELEAKVVRAAGKEMRYLEKTFGKAKAGERSLFISMHGGGGAPARVNDQQWRNQIRLYAPKEGIVVAPRAPTNTWNLWHEAHIDDLFDRLIANFVLQRGVHPDRVYLLGYSAGGDGVYQLAPRMADRFAAASMMAGHPNNASPLGLRNLPFMIFMGGNDGAYDRNKVAKAWGEKLAKLRTDDTGGYEHKVTIYEGLGHWMNGKDAESLPWMASRTRTPWPPQVVWHQSGRTHERFYWLAVPKGTAKRGQTVRALVKGQRIEIQAEGLEALTLRLGDELIDLDKPVVVTLNGKQAFRGKVKRSMRAIWDSLRARPDPRSVATAVLEIKP
ncbi:MAG: transglutaminase domain-containing protein [Planctomycetota bacterium]|nr:transglutaminase domain-containing protein [Planctomycetota bacterium]